MSNTNTNIVMVYPTGATVVPTVSTIKPYKIQIIDIEVYYQMTIDTLMDKLNKALAKGKEEKITKVLCNPIMGNVRLVLIMNGVQKYKYITKCAMDNHFSVKTYETSNKNVRTVQYEVLRAFHTLVGERLDSSALPLCGEDFHCLVRNKYSSVIN